MARRLVVVVAALLAVLLPVSGAGGSPLQTPKRGGTVVAPTFGGEPACLTVFIESCFSGGLVTTMDSLPDAVLPGAFELLPDLTWRERLVTHVDVARSPPLTLTYHIRPEARWSDGVPVTADDFVFTLRTLRRHATRISDSQRALLDRVSRVEWIDEGTVRVALRSRVAGWRGLFSSVLPRHALRGVNYATAWRDRIENPRTGGPIGSGAFLVASWDRGRRLTLVRNPRYWGQHRAYLDRLVFRFDEIPAPDIAFPSGEVDQAWGFPPAAISLLRGIPGVSIRSGPAPFLEHFVIRVGPGGHPALRSKLMRRALAYGIDREAIVREIYGEILPLQRLTDSTLFMNSSPYYRPNWSAYRYRPGEARRLLEQAGCRRGPDGIYLCGSERLALRFYTRGDFSRRVRTLDLVQAQLRRVGVEVVPTFASGSVLANQILPSGNYDVVLVGVIGATADDVMSRLLRCGAPDYTGYCQRLVTADLDQADRILDAERRARVLNRADAQVARDVPVIPLYWTPTVAAVRSTVKGYVFHPVHPFWGAEDWWLDD